jgi:cytochrome c-type biogenesis protein CcmH/NrfG
LRSLVCVLVLLASFNCQATQLDQAREYIGDMEYTQAIEALQAYLVAHPSDVEARYLLARTYAWDNQYAQAEQVYDQLLNLQSENSEYLLGKAQALLWQNQQQAAVPLLESVIKLNPEQTEAWRLLILSLQQSQDKADQQTALEYLKQARARFPKENWDAMGN